MMRLMENVFKAIRLAGDVACSRKTQPWSVRGAAVGTVAGKDGLFGTEGVQQKQMCPCGASQ